MVVYPDGIMYVEVKAEDIPELVERAFLLKEGPWRGFSTRNRALMNESLK